MNYLLINSSIQLVETRHNVSHVDPWLAILADLMKDVVTKQLQHVPVAVFTPAVIHVEPAKSH